MFHELWLANSVIFLEGLTKLESLNLDSCRIGDEGLRNLTGWFVRYSCSILPFLRIVPVEYFIVCFEINQEGRTSYLSSSII